MSSDAHLMPLADFLELVRTRRDLFPQRRLQLQSGLGRSTLRRAMRFNPKQRGATAPSLATLQQLAQGCGAEILILLPPTIRA